MARELPLFKTLFLFLFISLIAAGIASARQSADPGNSSVEADSPVEIGDVSVITIVLRDERGGAILLEPEQIELKVEAKGAGVVQGPELIDKEKAIYEATVGGEIEETAYVTVHAGNIRLDDQPEIEFVKELQNVDPERSEVRTELDKRDADGEDQAQVRAIVFDGENPVSGLNKTDFDIRFKSSEEPEIIAVKETEIKGEYLIYITYTVPETIGYTVSVLNVEIGEGTLTFELPGPLIDPEISNAEATSPHLADGNDPSVVTVDLRDSDNNNLQGDVSLSDITISPSGSATLGDSGQDSAEGVFFFLVYNTVAETVTVNIQVTDPENGETVTLDAKPEIVFEPEGTGVSASESLVFVSPEELDADGESVSVLSVELRNDDGGIITDVPIEDVNVDFGNGSAEIVNEILTEQYQFEIVNTVAEAVTATVSVNDPREGVIVLDRQGEILFTSVIPSREFSTLEATSPHAANGSDASTVTVTAMSENDNPVSDMTSGDFDITVSGDASSTEIQLVDEEKGTYEFEVTNNTAEEVIVEVTARGEDLGAEEIRFNAPEEFVDVEMSDVDATSPHVADGNDASVVTAVLKDSGGNGIDGINEESLALSVESGNGDDLTLGSFSSTGSTGEFVSEVTSTQPGSYELSVNVNGRKLVKTSNIEFTEPNISSSSSSAEATSPHKADGEDASTVTVNVVNENDEPVGDLGNDDFAISLTGSASATNVSNMEGGEYQFQVTNTVAETVTVTIRVDGRELDDTPQIVFEEIETTVDASNSSVEATSPHDADGNDASTVFITLRDDNNDPKDDVNTDSFDIDLTGNAEATDVTNEGGGEYEFQVTNNTAETVTVTVTVEGVELDDTPQIVFEEIETTVHATNSSVEATSPHDADGSDASTVFITLRDDNNDPKDNVNTGSFNIDLTGNAEATDVTNEGSGMYEFQVTNNTAETVTVMVTVEGVELDDTPQIVFESVQLTPDAAVSSVEATSPHIANGSDASTVTVDLRNNDNEPINNLEPADFLIDVTGSAEFSDAVKTDNQGEYQFEVTNTVEETVTVTVTADDVELDDQPEIVFEASAVTVSASNSSVEATSPHNADGQDASTVTIDLRDEDNNSLFDEFSFSDFDIDLSGSATQGDNGVSGENFFFLVYNEVAETVTVTISVRGAELDDTPQIVFESEDIPIPEPPIIAEIDDISDGIELRWEIGSDDFIDQFNIYRGTSVSDMELYDTIPAGQNSYVDEDPVSGTIFYAVSAVNELNEEGDLSNLVNFYNGILSTSGEWKMVSTPVNGTHSIENNITAFAFTNRYEHTESMTSTEGYWMKTNDNSDFDFSIRGKGVTQVSIDLKEGWNMIGGISDNISVNNLDDPGGILTQAPVYHYSDGEYQQVEDFEPDKGYWLYASESGSVELSVEEVSKTATKGIAAAVTKSAVNHSADLPKLKFSRDGFSRSLHIDIHQLSDEEKYAYLLPPPAPEQSFNVRSDDGFGIIPQDGGIFSVESEGYPVFVTLQENENLSGNFYQLVLRKGNSEHTVMLEPGRTLELTREYDEIALVTSDSNEAIREHKLLPNYPNPFNPATTIEYQIRENTQVKLEVYDVSGRRVQVLANENLQAGQYSALFDGSNVSSGIYMVRFQAGNEVQIRKITLIK